MEVKVAINDVGAAYVVYHPFRRTTFGYGQGQYWGARYAPGIGWDETTPLTQEFQCSTFLIPQHCYVEPKVRIPGGGEILRAPAPQPQGRTRPTGG